MCAVLCTRAVNLNTRFRFLKYHNNNNNYRMMHHGRRYIIIVRWRYYTRRVHSDRCVLFGRTERALTVQ